MSFEQQEILPKESRQGDVHAADFGENKIDIYKLIHLAELLETETIDIAELDECKHNNYWKDKNGNWLGPQQILNEVSKYQSDPNWDEIIVHHPEWRDEIDKISHVDYKIHPIIIVDGIVVDGIHRLTKAWIDKAETIEVKKFQELPKGVIILE